MATATAFQGKICRGEHHRFPMSLEDREAGLTVYDVCPEPPQTCEICGNGIWHYWIFFDAAGSPLVVGEECARIATGGEPPARYLDQRDQVRRDQEREERRRAQAAEYTNWWKAPAQRDLRRLILAGLREERRHGASDFYARTYGAATTGKLSEKWRAWVERHGDGRRAANRAAEAHRILRALGWIRPGRFDRDIIRDMRDRQFPMDGGIWCPPMSDKQIALLRKLETKYRGQIAKLEAWQRY